MTQYLLSIFQPDGAPPPGPQLEAIMADVGSVDQAMRDAGVWVFSGGLHPPGSAVVLRAQDGDVRTSAGPLGAGDEHLGGFTIVDVSDLDAALEWGARLARATTLPVEVRAFQ